MPATVAQLGARALRKLGVALVADAERPASGPVVTAAVVADRVVRELGILVPESERPAPLPPLPLAQVADLALRATGINPNGVIGGIQSGTVYTYAQIADAALIKLGVIAAEEAPAAADKAQANARVIDAHDTLAGLGYADWLVSAIPSYVAEAYIVMAANLLAPSFGRPASMENYAAALEMVRQQVLSGARGQAVAVLKVQAVHDHLNALGLVSWPVTAIPQAYVDDYVAMAATLLKPVSNRAQDGGSRQVDKAEWDAAEGNVRKAAVVRGARARAADLVAGIQAELNAAGLITWDANHIPLSMADAMSAMVLARIGPQFGREADPKAYDAAEQRVWRYAMGGPAGQKLAEQKVRAVQAYLEARGIARWTQWDVPPHVEEPIVFMAAVWLAPECKVQAEPHWWPAAERTLHQMVELPSDYSPVVGSFL